MGSLLRNRRFAIIVPLLLIAALVIWQASVALADAPKPEPLVPHPEGSIEERLADAALSTNGPAAAIHGDPGAGRVLFASDCATCHGDRGIGNVANPGSDDGTVPPLNPIDPGFVSDAQGDPSIFAKAIDLFIQHGSRPEGDNPQFSMIAWGDQKLLSQQQIADVEAYVMQVNGAYWPDRWAPPAEVRVKATQQDDTVTYSITLVNHGSSVLSGLGLRDTLPAGLTYVSSYLPDVGQNPGKWTGSTVEWTNLDGVPQGGTLGPFVIVAQVQGATIPANVAELSFTWASWDGTTYQSSAISPAVVPSTPKTAATAVSHPTGTPVATVEVSTTSVATAMVTATALTASSPQPTGSVKENTPEATTPTAEAATPTTAPATPTPVPAPVAQTIGVQIVQPSDTATSWGYNPPSVTIHVGDSVSWANQGPLAHTVTADDSSFDSGSLNAGASWSMTFNTEGTYNYHCTPHPWMKGTVVVQAAGQ